MDEMMPKSDQNLLRVRSKCLLYLLQTADGQFQNGDDAIGIENLLAAIAELEKITETDHNSQQPQIDLSRLLPDMRRLHFYIQNQDITGITDFIEYAFCPMTEELLKGCDGI